MSDPDPEEVKEEAKDLARDIGDVHIEDVDMTAEELADSRYAVAKWKPLHDTVLALHLSGYKNTSIGAIVGLDPSYVGDLLNDPRAKKAISKLRQRLLDNQVNTLEDKLALLGGEALDNIRQTVTAEIQAGSRAKKHQDKVSFDVLELIGVGQDKEADGGMKLSKDASERLAEALDDADKAQEEHAIDMEQSDDGSYRPSENGDSE